MAQKSTENGKRRIKKAAPTQTNRILESQKAVPAGDVATGNLHEEIRQRAYELYLQRGGMPGDENQDWLVAEQEVRSRQLQHVS